MKVSLSLLILVSNIIHHGRASRRNHDEGMITTEHEVLLDVEPVTVFKEWPEQHFATDSEEKLPKIVKLQGTFEEDEQNRRQDSFPEDEPRNARIQKLKDDFPEDAPVNSKIQKLQDDFPEDVPLNSKIQKLQDDFPEDLLVGRDYFRVDSEESDTEGRRVQMFDKYKNQLNLNDQKEYNAELAAGDMTQLFGTNRHLRQPQKYLDLGRRFVLQYPYVEVANNKLGKDGEDSSLIPKKASPELVLAVAKESAMLEAASPVNPTEDLIRKDSLRTGEYWNAFWKEDVNPDAALRTLKRSKVQTLNTKLSPGTELYKIVSKLKQMKPKLLYVINKSNKH